MLCPTCKKSVGCRFKGIPEAEGERIDGDTFRGSYTWTPTCGDCEDALTPLVATGEHRLVHDDACDSGEKHTWELVESNAEPVFGVRESGLIGWALVRVDGVARCSQCMTRERFRAFAAANASALHTPEPDLGPLGDMPDLSSEEAVLQWLIQRVYVGLRVELPQLAKRHLQKADEGLRTQAIGMIDRELASLRAKHLVRAHEIEGQARHLFAPKHVHTDDTFAVGANSGR